MKAFFIGEASHNLRYKMSASSVNNNNNIDTLFGDVRVLPSNNAGGILSDWWRWFRGSILENLFKAGHKVIPRYFRPSSNEISVICGTSNASVS